MLRIALLHATPQANGHSIILDGIAFGADEQSREMVLVEAGPEEGIYLAELDLAVLRAYQEREVWGNAFRRPGCYSRLTASNVEQSSSGPGNELIRAGSTNWCAGKGL